MSEPEISRRCPECGASIRAHVSFCPQCGKRVKGETAKEDVEPDRAEQPSASVVDSRATAGPPKGNESKAPEPTNRKDVARADAAEHRSKVSIQRAATTARDSYEDNVLPRVERLRKASEVVLEDAGYDPSLRFVLVAVALFVLFLILLLLSKWLG